MAASSRFGIGAVAPCLALAALLTLASGSALSWGVKATHPNLAEKAVQRADQDGEISKFLAEELGLSEGVNQGLELRLGFDTNGLDREIGPADNSRLNRDQNRPGADLNPSWEGSFAPSNALAHFYGPTSVSQLVVFPICGLRDAEAAFIADGSQVREIAIGLPSPIAVVQQLRTHLAANDVQGALLLIHPTTRQRYARVYGRIQSELATQASNMANFRVELMRSGRATVLFDAPVPRNGGTAVETFPITLVREGDGQWLVLEY